MTDKDLARRLDLLLHIWQVTLVLNTQNCLIKVKFSHTCHEGKEGSRGQHHALTTLPWKRNLVLIDMNEGWVGPRAGLDVSEDKICDCNLNSGLCSP